MPNIKKRFDNCAKYEQWIDKIQALERLTHEVSYPFRHRQRNLDKNLWYHCMMTLKRDGPGLLENQP